MAALSRGWEGERKERRGRRVRGFRWGDEVPEIDGGCVTLRVLLSATELCTST